MNEIIKEHNLSHEKEREALLQQIKQLQDFI